MISRIFHLKVFIVEKWEKPRTPKNQDGCLRHRQQENCCNLLFTRQTVAQMSEDQGSGKTSSNVQQAERKHVKWNNDSFSIFHTGNTHPEASSLCFVVVWRGIRGCSSFTMCCTNKVSNGLQPDHKKRHRNCHICSASADCCEHLDVLFNTNRCLFGGFLYKKTTLSTLSA